jgi:hypothetical protein
MATQYTSILKLALPTTGELDGTWGTTVNDNITSMIEEAIAGSAAISSWTANSHTLTTANGTTSESRAAMLILSDDGAGNPSAAAEVICPTATKIYIVQNGCGQAATLKTSAGTGISVPNGETMLLFCDGTNVVEGLTYIKDFVSNNVDIGGGEIDGTPIGANSASTGAFTTLTASTSLNINSSTTVDGVLDEDNMASDSATKLATQQSIKAYVDAQIGVNNELSEVLANGNTSGGTNLIMSAGDTLTTDTIGETTAAAGVTIDSVLLKDDTVNASDVETTYLSANDGTQAAVLESGTGKMTIASSVLTTTDINGGTIDGATIGGSSAGAGTFTTLTASSNVSFDGGTIKLDGDFPTGGSNVALGNTALDDGSLTGGSNTAIGSGSLTANTSGQENTAVGKASMASNTTGGSNTSVGKDALVNNTTASNNTVVGYQAGYSNTTGADNTAVGYTALYYNTTGSNNTALGKDASVLNTTGSNNVAVGENALRSNTTASNNTAVGYQAGYSNTTGTGHAVLGYGALQANTTGNYNIAIGYQPLSANTDGAGNSAIGYRSLYSNTSGYYNVANGHESLYSNTTGITNTAIGVQSLRSNTTASGNTAVGYQAGYENTTGDNIVAVGYQSLRANTTGAGSTALGYRALNSNITGNNNSAVGNQALYYNSTGADNIAMGSVALYSNTTGSNNTALGRSALNANTTASNNTAVGYQALYSNTSGSNNTAIGNICADDLTTGSNNIYIGYDVRVGGSTETNAIAIGAGIRGIGANSFAFGKGTGSDRVYNLFTSNASWTRVSDERTKKNIEDNTDCGLSFINRLRTVTYNKKAPSEMPEDFAFYDASQTAPSHAGRLYGMIAQDVKAAMDAENIADFGGWHEDEISGSQAISQEMFVIPLIKAIQELKAEVDALKAQLNP